MLLHPVEIGNLKLDSNLFLAPMAGYTDKVYRGICLKHHAALAYTEMVSCEGIARNSGKTIMLMDRAYNEMNLAVQLFAPDGETVKRSLEGVLKVNPALIDINMGCPVPKVTKTGCGSALLKTPEKIYEIVKTLKDNTDIPITVKIRTGWDSDTINYIDTSDAAFSAGADALCMHARTKTKLYMPYADWTALRNLKSHYPGKIIIGSGDIFTAEDAVRMLSETKADAVAFARGAIGNPFVFEQTEALLQGIPKPEITNEMRTTQILEHLSELAQYIGEVPACREMRKHVCGYLKGIPNSAKIRNLAMQAISIKQYREAMKLL